jgi:hypothetical protein
LLRRPDKIPLEIRKADFPFVGLLDEAYQFPFVGDDFHGRMRSTDSGTKVVFFGKYLPGSVGREGRR